MHCKKSVFNSLTWLGNKPGIFLFSFYFQALYCWDTATPLAAILKSDLDGSLILLFFFCKKNCNLLVELNMKKTLKAKCLETFSAKCEIFEPSTQLSEFHFQFRLGWFSIINNLIINKTNWYYNNRQIEYSLFRLSLFWASAWDPLNPKKNFYQDDCLPKLYHKNVNYVYTEIHLK